jgi:hypothetical protein
LASRGSRRRCSEHIGSEPHTRLRYFCSPYHEDSSFYPVIVQLERAAGFARDDGHEAKLDKLATLLAPAAEADDISLLVFFLQSQGCGENRAILFRNDDIQMIVKEEKLFALMKSLRAKRRCSSKSGGFATNILKRGKIANWLSLLDPRNLSASIYESLIAFTSCCFVALAALRK